jgi:hypothetical protein
MKHAKRTIILGFLILGAGLNLVNGQTIGGNQDQIANFKHLSISQSIGQPYAVFSTTLQRKYSLNQGQILPQSRTKSLNNKLKFKIYPNPVIDVLHVGLESATHISGIDIYDINGRVMSQRVFPSTQNSESMNLAALSSGVYIIYVKDTEGNSASLKFTKASTTKK